MIFTTSLDITWDRFAACQSDPKKAFEDLARQLFNNRFCPRADLSSVDNNPGVEVEPVCVNDDKGQEKWISFQAKHFENNVKYDDIKDSCRKAAAYYKGRLDLVYLYCNKNLNPCP